MQDNFHDYEESIVSSKVERPVEKKEPEAEGASATDEFTDFVIPKNMTIENEGVKPSFAHHFQQQNPWNIMGDHCYARPWNWRPESSFLKPTKTLFMSKGKAKKVDSNDNIDVEAIENDANPIYDLEKTKQLSEECEAYAALARADKDNDNWEEDVLKVDWTSSQNRLFNGIVNILTSDKLSRSAYKDTNNEAICKRTIIDKSVQRVRRLLASFFWDQKLVQWLHQLLLDNLSKDLLGAYLDILQTLRSKLPLFVEKMLFGPTVSRSAMLNTESLFPLLKRPWEPLIPSLTQEKPNKLPGSPIIVVVPSSPMFSNRHTKWINLLSQMANVVNIPFNFGSSTSGHRMAMTQCADQLFATVRSKIQEIRNNFPGKQIILVGFNAGATLALQVAHVEAVLCVVSIGFSLLTADGRRGEPDDNLMELQCPVLFVIGQCSNTSLQEDMEDLRERMRVETGLIVVGAADNNLRISKKKKRAEGITQSVVDRCVVDEIGDFISNLILSPYPPQLRQSPTHIPNDSPINKKTKAERRRFNSNGSSLDSEEPPSPTPNRLSRGRPIGSKTKGKLEAKWAAQVAQGTPSNIPPDTLTPSTSPPSTPITLDSSSNDSNTHFNLNPQTPTSDKSLPLCTLPNTSNVFSCKTTAPGKTLASGDVPPLASIKKIKTLKPVQHTPEKGSPKNSPVKSPAKLQAYGLAKKSIIAGSHLSTLLQGGVKTLPPTQPRSGASTIKVLENVTINSGTSKYGQPSNRSIDMSKLTVLNSLKSGGGSMGNVVLLPDGKIKSIGGSMFKGSASSSLTTPHSTKKATTQPPNNVFSCHKSGTRYITSKKQLLGNRPSKLPKKHSYLPQGHQLAPPTNLTTQDIMDLPIIFADDNQILDTSRSELSTQPLSDTIVPPTQTIVTSLPKIITSTPGSKFVLVNKPMNSTQNNFIISQPSMRANTYKSMQIANKQTAPKYTKIILSKRMPSEDKQIHKIVNLSSEISVKKVPSSDKLPANIDLESELVATAVPKPSTSTDIKHITLYPPKVDVKEEIKRSLVDAFDDDINDPDYKPPKMFKSEF